jgi:hypothetical protein
MRNSSKGGMQTSGLHSSIICKKCGKPAARMERDAEGNARFMHYTNTKLGIIWHTATKKESDT